MDPNIPVQQTQPVTQPTAPPVLEQPSQSKPKLSKWIIAVVVVLLLLIVGGVSAYVLNKNSMKKVLPSPTPVAIVSQTPTVTLTPNPTANWKAYTNNDYKFSFQYPSDWVVADHSIGKSFSIGITGPKGLLLRFSTNIFGVGGLCDQNTDHNMGYIPFNFMGLNTNMFFFGSKTDGTISYAYLLENHSSETPTPCPNIAFFDIKSIGGLNNGTRGGLESVNISYTEGGTMKASDFKNSNDFSIVKQILATFKSTDQTSQTANDPTKVVNDFYSAYVDCLQKWDTANLKGTGPASPNTCPSFSTYPVFSSDLISKLNQVKGADPILCAQNIPASIKVDNANTNGNTSSVTVHTYYLSSGDNPIPVGLTLENNNWLITSITCANGIK